VAAAAVAADAHEVAAVAAASEAADNEGVIDLTHDDDAVDLTTAAAGPDGFASPSKAALIDLTGAVQCRGWWVWLGSVLWHPLQGHNLGSTCLERTSYNHA
jgi:hypothetical protein